MFIACNYLYSWYDNVIKNQLNTVKDNIAAEEFTTACRFKNSNCQEYGRRYCSFGKE